MNLYAASVALLWTTALRASGVGAAAPLARQSTGSVPRTPGYLPALTSNWSGCVQALARSSSASKRTMVALSVSCCSTKRR